MHEEALSAGSEAGPEITVGSGEREASSAGGVVEVLAATELVEVFPNVVAVFGALPAELESVLEPLNAGLFATADHDYITNALAGVGHTAAIGGNLAQTVGSAQRLYRFADESRALIEAGGRLAVKDGKNLGTIIQGSGKGLAQARFIPATGLTAAQAAVAIGPTLAMIALQSQLNEVSSLVRRNIQLTEQVIENTRREERARLMSLVDTVTEALDDAQAAGAVPSSLWDTFAGKKADLRAERSKYRANVENHISKISASGVKQRREYLQSNAQAVVFDAFALLSTLKAWVGYHLLSAAVAREAGMTDSAEAKHFDSIVSNIRRDLEVDRADVTKLLGALTRELRIVAELPGPTSLMMSSKRRDIEATRKLASRVLAAIAPLSDVLLPIREPLAMPEVVCAPSSAALDTHLGVLRWLLEPDEHIHALGIGGPGSTQGRVGAVVDAAKDRLASALDREVDQLMVVVTDRRILSGSTNDFLREALIENDVALADVRYVRSVPGDGARESRVDVITRDHNLDWSFGSDVDTQAVDSLAAVLAVSMTLPETEREDLLRRAPEGSVRQLTAAQR